MNIKVVPPDGMFLVASNASVKRKCCSSQAFSEGEGKDLTNVVKPTARFDASKSSPALQTDC